jgi:hypothetical protein
MQSRGPEIFALIMTIYMCNIKPILVFLRVMEETIFLGTLYMAYLDTWPFPSKEEGRGGY